MQELVQQKAEPGVIGMEVPQWGPEHHAPYLKDISALRLSHDNLRYQLGRI